MSNPLKAAFTLTCLIVLLVTAFAVLARSFWSGPSPAEWVSRYGPDAEQYALASLSVPPDSEPKPPQTLSTLSIERGPDYVSFCKPSGGPFASSGYAYSTSGHVPVGGLGGEPRILRWQHLSGHWYAWSAD